MALEVIGGIASILQLAGTVYTISKTLYEVGEALSNAPSDIKDLARDLETFSDELHLLSTLLHGKDGRYADQVYRLTAKIIGDCATICTKIDRIIRKLRSGSVLAKIKWLYKEKEIMKLLARLRDLKLSLMGTLSVLSALRADNMMDSLGINNPSLIGGPNRHGLSTETRMQVEDTRLKLAGMSMKDTTGSSSGSESLLPSSASLVSGGSSSTLSTSATSTTCVSPPTTRMPSTTSFSTSPFISMAVVPNSMPPILNTQANQSVDSFHSALSYQNQSSQDSETQRSLTPTDPSHALSSPSLSLPQPTTLQGTRYPIARACNECRKKKQECDGKEPCDQCTSQSGGGDRLEDYCAYGPLEKNSSLRDGDVKPTDEQMKQVEPEDLSHIPVIPRPVMVSDGHGKPSFSADGSHELDASVSKSLKSWRNEMALSAMKHFNMNTLDAEEWAKHLPVPSNISERTGLTDQAETLSHPNVENKLQEIENGKGCHGYQGGSTSQYEYYEALERESSCEISDLIDFMPEMGYIPSAAHSHASPEHVPVESDSAKSQNRQIDAVLGSSMRRETHFGGFGDNGPRMEEVDGYAESPAYSPASPVYSFREADSSPIEADTIFLSFAGGEKFPNDSTLKDESTVVNDFLLTDEKKMTQSSPKYTTLESFDVKDRHDYNTNFTEQANSSSQVPSNFGPDSIDMPITPIGYTSTQTNNPDPSKCLPRKLDLPSHEIQLRLLEDQDNRRLEIAKQEQQNSYHPSLKISHLAGLGGPLPKLDIPANEFAYRDYQRHLILTEEENKDRLALTQQMQRIQNSMLPSNSVAPTRQAETSMPIQMQQQQQQQIQSQQQQQQRFRLSPYRRLGVTERVTGVDCRRWHNSDACQSKEISANIPSGLYGLGNEDLLPKSQSEEIKMLNQASQETYERDGQPYDPSISPCGKSEPRGRMELPPDYTDDMSRQGFKLPKIDKSNNDSTIHFQNEVSNKGPGGFWIRGFINVKSFDAVIWSNLEHYLKWQRVYTTSEAGSIPLVANLDWSATLYKERIALRRQMFPRAASSIQKILDVLAVMEETIGLKIGAIAWACLLGAVENLLSHGRNWTADSQIRIITEMSEIASIIARYTVMGNIYSQWKGMSLDKDYEQSLINLSTHVLIYLGAFVPSLSESSTNADMKPYFDRIIEADTACRGFTVIVSSKNTGIDRKRPIEEFSDDSDDTVDSDGTILGVDGNDEVNDMPSSAKRTKIQKHEFG